MSKSTKIPKSQVIKALVDQLKKRTDEYLEKKRKFDEELSSDLDQLNTSFGVDIVKMVLSAGGIATRKSRTNTSVPLSNTEVPDDFEPVSYRRKIIDPKPTRTDYKDKESDGKKDGVMGIAELRPHIKEAVDSLKGKEFIRKDVDDILQNKGLDFDYACVSFVLRRMDELEVIGHRATGKGPPSKVYKHKKD